MHELAPLNPWVALAYLIAGVCFIIALRGLSSPSTSRRGNRFGMFGMGIRFVDEGFAKRQRINPT